jgi:hypothetical protein
MKTPVGRVSPYVTAALKRVDIFSARLKWKKETLRTERVQYMKVRKNTGRQEASGLVKTESGLVGAFNRSICRDIKVLTS